MSTSNTITSSPGPSVYRSIPTFSSNSNNFCMRSSNYNPRKSHVRPSTSVSWDSRSSLSSLPTRRPRTSASTRACGRDNHSFIVAVIEGRGKVKERSFLVKYIYIYIN